MRSSLMACLVMLWAVAAYAKEPKTYQTAKLLQMNSVNCGTTEKDATSPLGEIIGTDNHNRKNEQVLCQEYVLQADALVYHIRPLDQKHPALLPIGSNAQYRIDKDKMMLRIEGVQDKELRYTVVSIAPRTDPATASASAPAR